MTATSPPDFPHWLNDVDAHLPVSSQFVLHGNIRDQHLVPVAGGFTFRSTLESLATLLHGNDYTDLLVHDPVNGLRRIVAPDTTPADLPAPWGDRLGRPLSPEALAELVRAVQAPQGQRTWALAIDYVSQVAPTGQPVGPDWHALIRTALVQSTSAAKLPRPDLGRAPLHNPVFWLVDRPSDLPAWFAAAADGVHQVPVPVPDLDTRARAGRQIAAGLSSGGTFGPMSDEVRDRFVVESEGMTLRAMREVIAIARDRKLPADDISDAIRLYRIGLIDNPWGQDALKENVRNAESFMHERVLGQPGAIRRSLDILMRSTTGLTSAHTGGRSSGPRGVLFLAGPTGVGKTELAKTLTEVVFGNPQAYVRFDMSEFAHEGSDLRLIGAPPGYIGHEAGGELTNAIRQRPFSLVLFDEIEKADQKIMDKFLQILSDGRLTDGSGATVHFSESIIVFTSNKGMADPMEDGRLPDPETAFEELEAHVRHSIQRHFTETLGRPEILNRIGDNIVVFDYIRQDVAVRLLDLFIGNVVERVRDLHDIELELTARAHETLRRECCERLDMGGRGIGQSVESVLVNPLARAVFSLDEGQRTMVVSDIVREEGTWTLQTS